MADKSYRRSLLTSRAAIKSEKKAGQQDSAGRNVKHAHFQERAEDISTLDPRLSIDLLPSAGRHFSQHNLQRSQASPSDSSLVHLTTQKQGGHPEGRVDYFFAPVNEGASVEAQAKINDLQQQLVKSRADKDVLEITVKHLKTQLDG